MTDRRKRKKYNADTAVEDPWKPTPEELKIVKYLHNKLPSKEGRLSGMIVRIFMAAEAVQLLMNSPWAEQDKKIKSFQNSQSILFKNQSAVVGFMDTLLQKKLFHRATRVKKKSSKVREDCKVIKSKSKKLSDEKSIISASEDNPDKTLFSTKDTNGDNQNDKITTQSVKSVTSSITTNKNKPIRIEMVDEQVFILDDLESVYVWIYEPPPSLYNWLAGSALLIGIILCCLFPIWPSQLRLGTYYLTICASCLLGLLFGIAIVRLFTYFIVWCFTLGNYNFWLFPNYFEDCGFFESFRPFYSFNHVSILLKESKKDKVKLKSTVVSKPNNDLIKSSNNQLLANKSLTSTDSHNNHNVNQTNSVEPKISNDKKHE